MRNALNRIITDMRISYAKKYNTSADGSESLYTANAQMVGLTTFHMEVLEGLVSNAQKAIKNNTLAVAEHYVEYMVAQFDDLKERAERHEFL